MDDDAPLALPLEYARVDGPAVGPGRGAVAAWVANRPSGPPALHPAVVDAVRAAVDGGGAYVEVSIDGQLDPDMRGVARDVAVDLWRAVAGAGDAALQARAVAGQVAGGLRAYVAGADGFEAAFASALSDAVAGGASAVVAGPERSFARWRGLLPRPAVRLSCGSDEARDAAAYRRGLAVVAHADADVVAAVAMFGSGGDAAPLRDLRRDGRAPAATWGR